MPESREEVRTAQQRRSQHQEARDGKREADSEEDDQRLSAAVSRRDQPLLQLAHFRRRLGGHRAHTLQRAHHGALVRGIGLGDLRRRAGQFAETLLDRRGPGRGERVRGRRDEQRRKGECEQRKKHGHTTPRFG
ncbi:MAG: hypothetical protein AUH72_11430 [Acidobacteria bacterium 13_1_40CM_4_65_8]|nr:MAG: hypothetical protein AUH72_11430 [Acidobacteria bacterium 13_1_40CM_4_65_8]